MSDEHAISDTTAHNTPTHPDGTVIKHSNNDATIKAEIHAFWQWCLRTHRHRSLIENRCVQSGNTTFIPDLAAYSFLSGKLSDIRSAEDPCPATIARASGRDEKLRVEWRNQPCICTLH